MKDSDLFTHYSLIECVTQDKIFKALDKFIDNGKIEYIYEIRTERFKLIDLELSDKDIKKLSNMFYKHNVIPDLGYEEPDEFNEGLDMGYYEDLE